jgi:hypothetical protein
MSLTDPMGVNRNIYYTQKNIFFKLAIIVLFESNVLKSQFFAQWQLKQHIAKLTKALYMPVTSAINIFGIVN